MQIMQTSSCEELLASSSFWPRCLLALQPFNKKLEARCFPPCRHLLGAAFKLRLLPELCCRHTCVWPYSLADPDLRTWLPGLTSDQPHYHILRLLTSLAWPFWVLWDSPVVSKLPPLPACLSPSAPGSLSPSEQRLPLLLPST